MSNLHSEEQAYWRGDDSGLDVQAEHDWDREKARLEREFTGRDLLDVLSENDVLLESLAKLAIDGEQASIGLFVSALVRAYIKRECDLSVFGKVMK